MKFVTILLCSACAGLAWAADPLQPATPIVTLSAAANTTVPNDRMYASLRFEAENSDPARAAAEVNAKMAKALARVKGAAGIDVTTSGYSSYQITEKLLTRWRVTQSINLEGADFAAMAALVSKLQAEDQLLLSGMSFSVSADTRRKTEDALTQQAIKAWQARAQNAARGFGFETYQAGRVTIQTGEPNRPVPMMRMQAAGGGAPPVNVEGGNTDVSVTVSGDAILGEPRPR